MRVRISILYLLLIAVAAPAWAAHAPRADDTSSPGILVAALYEAVSAPPGAKHDWDRFRSLFAPDARLIVRGAKGLRTLTVDEFIAASPDREGRSFVERGLVTRMETYGHIAHAWSSYEAMLREGATTTVLRGINSFQMVEIEGAWKVVTIFWEATGSGGELPEDMRGK